MRYKIDKDYKDIGIKQEDYDKFDAMSVKANWRITRLPNGLHHGEYTNDGGTTWVPVIEAKTVLDVEIKIDHTISKASSEVKRKYETPVVVKTFTKPGKK